MSQLPFQAINAAFPRANIAGGQPLMKRLGPSFKFAGFIRGLDTPVHNSCVT